MRREYVVIFTFILLVFLLIPRVCAVDQTLTVFPAPTAKITDFSINPSSAKQNQIIEFFLTIENTGFTNISVSPKIDIFYIPTNSLVDTINFSPVIISAKNNVTLMASWNTEENEFGDYSAVAVVYYANESVQETESFSITASASPPGPPGIGGGGGGLGGGDIKPPIHPPKGNILRFIKIPVLEEFRPGESAVRDITIKNPTELNFEDLKVEVSVITVGSQIPKDWIKISPETFSLGPRQSKTLNIVMTVPLNAKAEDYKAGIMIDNGVVSSENFLILRVKPYPHDKPSVTRSVEIDKGRGITSVSIEVKNAKRPVKTLEIVEDVPKVMAMSADQIKFENMPSILEEDPVVKWAFEDVQPYETNTIFYEFPKVLDEYSPYVYWPIKQVNVYYATPLEGAEVSSGGVNPFYLLLVAGAATGIVLYVRREPVRSYRGDNINILKRIKQDIVRR
ncbi:MAG: hypothetical protein SVM80_05375 [Halobacteriota archaeon]|nr:hypothetical protein [Halobacteriota archaeon]